MRRLYEALVILPKSLTDEDVDGAIAAIKADLERVNGIFKGAARLGRRPFSRLLGKRQESGYYLVIDCELDVAQITALNARFKLNEKVFRAQIVQKAEAAAESLATAQAEK